MGKTFTVFMKYKKKLVKRTEAAVRKLTTSVEPISQIVYGINGMLDKINNITQATLETERLKLKILKTHKVSNSETSENRTIPPQMKEKSIKKENSNEHSENIENRGFIDSSMRMFKKTIESEFYNSKLNIKREYKLSSKSNFEL